jgi:fermentation-respiration switch protein FrsA (DUF1100 family)
MEKDARVTLRCPWWREKESKVKDLTLLFSCLCLVMSLMFSACGIEEKLIFHPSAAIERTPRDVGLQFDDLHFKARDGVELNGWFIPHREARSTLVWFHGNAGNISHRVENIKLLHEKVKINIFIFDYRGYGLSAGHVSEAGTYLDGEAALEFVRRELGVPPQRIILFGRSLGAAVATEMANHFDSQALILESPFASIRAMADIVLPWLPIGPLLRTRYDVQEKIRGIKTPLLVLHGDRDEVVPFEQGKLVFAAAPEPKKFFAIDGAGHNDTFIVGGAPYYRQLEQFIESTATNR